MSDPGRVSTPASIGRRIAPSLAACAVTALLLTSALALPASADQMNIAWDECGAAGLDNRSFACDTNSGQQTLVLSFSLTDSLPHVNQVLAVVLVQSLDNSLPDWWDFIDCRSDAIVVDADYSGLGACADPLLGQGTPTGPPVLQKGPAVIEIRYRFTLPAGQTTTLQANQEYYAGRIHVGNPQTVGAGACADCDEKLQIEITQIRISQTLGPGRDILRPFGDQVMWQDGPVPVHGRTWGHIKGMWR